MAKIKNQGEAVKDEVLNPQETVETATAETDKAEKVTNEAEIPDAVKKILKAFVNYAELAVDSHGGVYTDIKRVPAKEKAVLYKNPYYKQEK